MENRFLAWDAYQKHSRPHRHRNKPRREGAPSQTQPGSTSASMSNYALEMSAEQRALVILIENGGIDTGIPELVDKLLEVLPKPVISDDLRQKLIVFLHDKIKELTDTLLENAELAVNRYSSASPEQYGSVTVLRNGTASYSDLKNKLFSLSKDGTLIDLFILTHGRNDEIAVTGGINGAKIKQMRAEFGKPLSIRSVYMMNCVGASLNQPWIDTGAKTVSGTIGNNYLPEPSTFFFWQNWKQGQGFETAVNGAYQKTIGLMNDAVRGFIKKLPVPGSELLASMVDFANFDFVQSSAPVILGQGTVSIASDELSFTQSIPSRMARTTLSPNMLRTVGMSRMASIPNVAISHSSSYYSPSVTMAPSMGVSRMMNPAAVVIAGIEVADAIQIGLGAVSIVQSQFNGSSGSFQLVYDKAQRLLTSDARNKMPGSQTSKSNYSRHLMYIGSSSPIMDFAEANIIIEWDGNPYGEIGTPVIRRDLKSSSDWSKSSASVQISRLDRIPLPGTDPRSWPVVFSYEGNFDPVGNGHFEFSGEFEINAFGGLKFNRHEVVSRSAIDFAISGKPDDYVSKANDVIAPTPDIPQEQINYLKSNLP